MLALTGCDLDNRRVGGRVELVKAIEALRGKLRGLAQVGRVPVLSAFRPILKLLYKFLRVGNGRERVPPRCRKHHGRPTGQEHAIAAPGSAAPVPL